MKFLAQILRIKSYITAFLVIIVLTVFFFHYFTETVRIKKTLEENSQLKEIAMLSSKHIKDSIYTYMRFTEAAATQLSKVSNIHSDETLVVLERIAKETKVEFLEIIYHDNTRKSTAKGLFSPEKYHPNKNRTTISASIVNDNSYITFSTPVKKDGEIIAELRGSLRIDSSDSIAANSLLGKHGEIFFLKSDGTFLFPTKEDISLASSDNIFNFLQRPGLHSSIPLEELLNSLNAGKDIFFSYTYSDKTQFIHLSPIDVFGWYAGIAMPKDMLASRSISVAPDTMKLLAQILMIFLSLSFYIVYQERRHSKTIAAAGKTEEALIANIPCGVQKTLTNDGFTYEFVSQGFADMLDFGSVEEAIKAYRKSFWNSILPEDRDKAKESILSQLTENNSFEVIYRMRKNSGKIIYVLCKGSTINDADGKEKAYAVTLDISSTQKTVEALSFSEKKYEIATEKSNIFILEYDPKNDTLYTSPKCSQKFGLPLKMKRVTETFAKIAAQTVQEKDFLSMHQAFLNMLAAMKNGTESVSASHFILSQDGTHRFIVTTRLAAVYGDHGELLKVIGIIEDNTDAKAVEIEFLHSEKYRQALSKLYDRTYEYDLTNDIIIKGEDFFRKYTDKETLSVSDVKMYFTAMYTHSDDQALIQDLLTEEGSMVYLAKGISELDIEYRNKESLDSDDYRWKAAHITIFIDPLDNSVRNIWYLKDITDSVKKTEELKKMAENDPLTGIYNKKRTEALIIEALSPDGGNKKPTINALIMLDLDDFKNINDLMGHLFGDAVISEVSARIKDTFRSTDIIGRIGGDEFVIFMKDIPTREIAERKTKEACSMIRNMRSGEVKEFLISASAGIAFSPEHGTTFEQLYNKADIALYRSKDLGKDHITLYDERMGTDFERLKDAHNDIESLGSENFAMNMPHNIFKILCDAKDINISAKLVLELICKHFGFERGYIFENLTDNEKCRQTYEWCAEGVPPNPGMDGEINYETTFPNLRQCFSEDGVYLYKGRDSTKNLPSYFNTAGSNTGIAIAILDEGEYKGFIGFDCSDELAAELTQSRISDISISAQMVAIFMLNAKSDKKRAKVKEFTEKSFDETGVAGYVVDYKTHEILFANKTAKETFLKNYYCGVLCYSAIFHRQTPCEKCPMEEFKASGKIMSVVDIPDISKCHHLFITPCVWEDGRETYFITHIDLLN